MNGRVAALGSLAVFLGVWLWCWGVLPEQGVAHHMGLDGTINRIGSRAALLWPLLGLAVFLGVMLGWLPGWLASRYPDLINYPNKEYWFAPERAEATVRRLTDEMCYFAAATWLLMTVVLYEVVRQTLHPGPSVLIWVVLGAYLLFTLWWTWWLLRNTQVPAEQ